jgi:hypothetical protein
MSGELDPLIRQYLALARAGEPTYDVYTKMKKLVKKKGLKIVTEQQPKNGNVAAVEAPATQEATTPTPTPEKPKRGGNRRNTGNGSRRKANGASEPALPVQMVTLDPVQLSNLWKAAMGGPLVVELDDQGQIVGRVSLVSLEKALPVLLDSLKGG